MKVLIIYIIELSVVENLITEKFVEKEGFNLNENDNLKKENDTNFRGITLSDKVYFDGNRLYHFYESKDASGEVVVKGCVRYYIERTKEEKWLRIHIKQLSKDYSYFEFPKGTTTELNRIDCIVEANKKYLYNDLVSPCAPFKTGLLDPPNYDYIFYKINEDGDKAFEGYMMYTPLDDFQPYIISQPDNEAYLNEIRSLDEHYNEEYDVDKSNMMIPLLITLLITILLL